MPYTNYVYVKLKLSIFTGDNRFLYQLNDRQQLLMLKLIALSGICRNKIPADFNYIKNQMNLLITSDQFAEDVSKIQSTFKTLVLKDGFYHWTTFDSIVNYKKKE